MAVKKVVIIGGVAGGATAAGRARRLSEEAEIVVLERGPDVSFANCGLPYYIGGEIVERDALLLQTPATLRAKYGLDVRVRNEVLSIDRKKKTLLVKDLEKDATYTEPYDTLLISTGAAPVCPPLPGIEHARVFTLRNVQDTDAIKKVVDEGAKRAVVVGGGFVGLEMVENLRRRGLDVCLVELLDQVMPPLDKEMATSIHERLKENDVDLRLGDAVESFADEAGQVRVCLRSGGAITADLVVLAIGVKVETRLAKEAGLSLGVRDGITVDDHMKTSDPNIYAVGDAVVVKDFVTGADVLIPLAGPANRQGRIAADNMLGRDSTYRGTQGTSILGIFGMSVAMTGASEKSLKRAGIAYEKTYVHPNNHVDYFPGAEMMQLKLLYAPGDGRVLGAQITGGAGVDKRIDVIAMAIQAKMTVYDLEEVELAYAPQFGAAKDAVNMAGFAAANALRGDVKVLHVDAIDKEALLLDVRDAEANAADAIPGSVLIPLPLLRERHGELPKDQKIQVHCKMGLSGYVAVRFLSQLGYDTCNVSGGMLTYRAFFPEER